MRLGTAGQGGAWYGWVRQGTGSGVAWPGRAGLERGEGFGKAGRGAARCGKRMAWN